MVEAEYEETPFERIAIDPEICLGKPRVRGTRMTVEFVLKLMRSGCSVDDMIRDYPELTVDDIHQCVAYGADRID